MTLRFNAKVLHCSFCEKPQSEVKKLIAGPEVYICGNCVTAFAGLSKSAAFAKARSENCSFCGKSAREVDVVSGDEQTRICNECLELCQEIMADDLRSVKG